MIRLALLLLALSAEGVLGCSCGKPGLCDLVHSGVLFTGEVIGGGLTSLRADPMVPGNQTVEFRVIEAFRGLPAGTHSVTVRLQPLEQCSPLIYVPGKRYLVHARTDRGRIVIGPCSQSDEVQDVGPMIEQVRRWVYGGGTMSIRGYAAWQTGGPWTPYLLYRGRLKPRASLTITASQGSTTVGTRTDSQGRYELNVPLPGYWHVPIAGRSVHVPAAQCVDLDVAAEGSGEVSGHVHDSTGKPVQGVPVELQAVDRGGRLGGGTTGETDAAGRFTIVKVPPGRYFVVASAGGPSKYRPWNPSWYVLPGPQGMPRTVEVEAKGGRHTGVQIVLGQKPPMRTVEVRAQFADGTPFKTAAVRITAPGSRPGDPEWQGFGDEAPADRPLQIIVTDRYGRDMHGTYIAEVPPGTSPVTRTFLIRD